MRQPKRTKYRKTQKGKIRGVAQAGATINFGEYGIQTLDRGYITARQIEAARVAITRHLKRRGKVWIRIFPDKSLTKKAAETRMGKGKGNPEEWVAVVKPGAVLYEVQGVPLDLAQEALRLAGHKLSVKTRFVTRGRDYEI